MRISSSDIQMGAVSQSIKKETEYERLVYWEGNKRVTENASKSNAAELDLSKKAQDLIDKKEEADGQNGVFFDKDNKKGNDKYKVTTDEKNAAADKIRNAAWEIHVNSKEEMTLKLLESFSSMVFGKKMKFKVPTNEFRDLVTSANQFQLKMSSIFSASVSTSSSTKAKASDDSNEVAGWGVSYERLYERFESEQMTFSAQGIVRTADGKEINLSLDLNMSRSLYEMSYTSIRAGELIDPLIINYAGPAADLTETKYSFDLDADGKEDQISFAGRGSGFLALDKNGDGKINDGNELFGTKSGDGFKDLAAYDEDGNGWIDEDDEIFNKLRIWVKDENGNDKLLSLGEVGVGAIYLGNVDSQIDIVGSDGQKNGQVSKTGIFLKENGQAGTIQHVDISV